MPCASCSRELGRSREPGRSERSEREPGRSVPVLLVRSLALALASKRCRDGMT
jgi:hypothetical protein